jgi:pyrroloquinoline quinone biosynthesis protein E
MGVVDAAVRMAVLARSLVRGPVAVRWNVTRRCDRGCSYCCARSKPDDEPELTATEALSLVEALGRAGLQRLSFSGGEPFLREDLGALTQRARQFGIHVSANTSGGALAMHPDRAVGLDEIKVSLDGPQEINDRLRGRASFDAAILGIEAARRQAIPVRLTTTLTKFNCSVEIVEHLLELARGLDAQVVFQAFHAHEGRAGEDLAPPREARDRVADHLFRHMVRRHPALGNMPFDLGMIRGRQGLPLECMGGRLFFVVEADGTIRPCDRVLVPTRARWTGGLFPIEDVPRVPRALCSGCGFHGSLVLNVAGNGLRGVAFAIEAAGYELKRALIP